MNKYHTKVVECTRIAEYDLKTGVNFNVDTWSISEALATYFSKHRDSFWVIRYCKSLDADGNERWFRFVLSETPKAKRKSHERFLQTVDTSLIVLEPSDEKRRRKFPHILVDPQWCHYYQPVEKRLGLHVINGNPDEIEEEVKRYAKSDVSVVQACPITGALGEYEGVLLVPSNENDLTTLKFRFV